MPRPAAQDYLQQDEQALKSIRRHLLSFFDEVIGIVLFAGLVVGGVTVARIFVGDAFWPRFGVPILIGAAVLAAAMLVARYWHTATSLYTITDVRVYKTYGRMRWFLLQTTFDKITDLHVKQGIFGRIFGYGTIRVMTAGTGLTLDGVRDPFGTKQQIEDARSAFLQTLIGEDRRARPTAVGPSDTPVAPKIVGMGDVLWQGKPVPASLLGAFLSSGVTLLFGFAIMANAEPPAKALIAGGLILLLTLTMGRAVITLRYTRFHVHAGGVVVTSGWLTKRRVETTYSKVTDVQTTQGVAGRMFGYGEIRINTAGSNEAPVAFQGVANPEWVKAAIDGARRES